ALTVRLPDGSERTFGDAATGPAATLTVHDDAAFTRILRHGEIGVGEAYTDGLWSSPDLVALLSAAARNRAALSLNGGWWTRPSRALNRVTHLRRRNTPAGSRANIEAHYDLGNDFYALFLDETMTYSSAVFAAPDQSLADAQREKYARIAALAGIRPGTRVLEIGGGWGGFAIWAASTLGARVTSLTISPAQHALATERVRALGLGALVDVRLCDYREATGEYDAVVSIEMLEAVGAEYYETYFGVIDRVLAPGGRAAIQVITVPDRAYDAQRRGVNWIQKHIFPGGLLPSLATIEAALADTNLLITRVDDIGPDYARTLAQWRSRFLARREETRALGLDDRFVRTWEYYLAISEVGFATRATQDLQIAIEHPAS
ncbi:MAG: cyclopropane-fatty-acyl-phospholipid synthase, partial [Chloroflexi bacterium]|nr:cyclopropane-fatty-acyl-phospholipid synthase [Chloroflexota bacterium]